jgi:hypothetical protein
MLLREEVQKRRRIEVRRNGNVAGIGASSSLPGNSVKYADFSYSGLNEICCWNGLIFHIRLIFFIFFQRNVLIAFH